jgi:serine/tyrosine/threonine adenylyltransferase
MMTIPQAKAYRADPAILEVADFLGDPVEGADFPQTVLRFRNDRAAASVGLDHLTDEAWISHFGRFQPLPDNLHRPLALRYHGHQFRQYNPDIGDGRGFLFAQMRDDRRRLLDLGTKGSGQTPYSRFGDGRLTLKGAVREILATEMLEALGVETSKTFSVIETGEALNRGDEPSPTRSAVLFRLSHGHIRIGSFQRLSNLGDEASLKWLIAYALKQYWNEDEGDDAPVRLLSHVVERTARLAASYMAAGFVHGVLNSDNINITGESFDYGPWRFAPTFDDGFTAAYFDHAGLYAFGRQAEAIHWDVAQLAISLSGLVDEDKLVEVLNGFAAAYYRHLADRFLWRLGVAAMDENADAQIVQAAEKMLIALKSPIADFFHHWAGGFCRRPDLYKGAEAEALAASIKDYHPRPSFDGTYFDETPVCSMLIEDVESIWKPIAERDDWSALQRKVEDIRKLGKALNKD